MLIIVDIVHANLQGIDDFDTHFTQVFLNYIIANKILFNKLFLIFVFI